MMIDVEFRLRGREIPVDHGYRLCSAIARIIPQIHGDRAVGIHAINGSYIGDRMQKVSERSCLRMRIHSDQIDGILPLIGQTLSLGNHTVTVGAPTIRPLVPSVRLYSRLVIIKGFTEPEPFLGATLRQLESLDVKGRPCLVPVSEDLDENSIQIEQDKPRFLRRTLRIHDKEIVGFALHVDELTAEESILLQEKGIGGRRRFGCGVFIADRR